MIFTCLVFLYSIYIILFPNKDHWSLSFLQIKGYHDYYYHYVLAYVIVNFIISYFAEKVIVSCLKGIYKRSKMKKLRKKIKKDEKEYNLKMIQTVKNFVKEQNQKEKIRNKHKNSTDDDELRNKK